MQQLTNAAQVAGMFDVLLQGVRWCAPKCGQCRRPLGDEQEQTHARPSSLGTPERICHTCFVDDLAEALVNQSPGLR